MGEGADSPETHLGSWAGAAASPRSPFVFSWRVAQGGCLFIGGWDAQSWRCSRGLAERRHLLPSVYPAQFSLFASFSIHFPPLVLFHFGIYLLSAGKVLLF